MSATEDLYGTDIYTEPDGDADTLANLGPLAALAALAGIWQGVSGADEHPVVEGTERTCSSSTTSCSRSTARPTDHSPRGQVLLAGGAAEADAREFEVTAAVGSEVYGILSNPFLDHAFRTLSYRMHVTVNDDGTWSYEEEGVLQIPGRDVPFHHTDRNTLTKIGPPTPNPLARGVIADGSMHIGSLKSPSRN